MRNKLFAVGASLPPSPVERAAELVFIIADDLGYGD